MFTHDQTVRMQTALQNSPNRNNLTNSAISQGAGTMSAPVAAFTFPSSICTNVSEAFTDASTGPPTQWAWSVSPSASVTVTTATIQNPHITFSAAGSYTVTLAATNTVGTNSISKVVTVSSCTTSSCDTVSNINHADTLTRYRITKGYLSGSGMVTSSSTTAPTSYTNQTIGEVYSQTTFPTNVTQVKGAMLLFYRKTASNIGTKGTSVLTLKMTNTSGTGTSMVPSTSVSATQTLSLSSVVAAASSSGVDYAGNNLFNMTGYLTTYPVMFATPVTIPATFGLTLSLPTVAGDTAVVWSNDKFTANAAGGTGCVQFSNAATWYNVATLYGIPVSFGIIPIVCPASGVGIEHNELGNGINLFPNPNSGQFNFAVTLPEATNLNFTIVNMLGQVVYTKSENNITNAVLSCDLSHLAKGVYYANILDSKNNKTVKKIIIE